MHYGAALLSLFALAAPATEDAASDEPATPVAEEAASDEPVAPRLLVLELVDQGAGSDAVQAIGASLTAELRAHHAGEVVPVTEVRASLEAEALSALSGCGEPACLAAAGVPLEAALVVGGSVVSVDDDVLVTVLLVDPRTGQEVARRQQRVAPLPAFLAHTGKRVGAELLGAPLEGALVPVRVATTPAGARVSIDGEEVGASPVVVSLAPGRHTVAARQDGFEPWQTTLEVKGDPLLVDAALVGTRLPLWPGAAGTGVLAVVAAAGASTFGLLALDAYEGTLGGRAQSYLYVEPADTILLAEKQQQVQGLAAVADTLWAVAVVSTVVALGLGAAEVASLALAE